MIPTHAISRIKEVTDLPALIAAYTPLRKSGHQWLVKCAWHKDHDPSMRVYSDHFFCFVCQASGTCVDWIMRFESMSCGQAIKYLADRAGISLDSTPVNPIQLAYAREEAALCKWWWDRMRGYVMDAGRIELASENLDQEYIQSLYRLRESIDAMTPRAKFEMFRSSVAPAERKEWEAERIFELGWAKSWMELARIA